METAENVSGKTLLVGISFPRVYKLLRIHYSVYHRDQLLFVTCEPRNLTRTAQMAMVKRVLREMANEVQ